MSRPFKTGLDYFPMDVNMDDKVELIEAKHGIIGFGVLIKLYQRIYKEGYYLRLTEETLLLFTKRVNVDINKVNDVINDCLRYGLFDESLYKKYNILTSAGIQRRYFTAVDRRTSLELVKEYIIVDINGINVNINWINDDNSTQSKVKKSKVNERKVIAETPEFIEDWKKDNEAYETVLKFYPKLFQFKKPLRRVEHTTLCKKYHVDNVFSIYGQMENKPDILRKYDSAYLTANNWLKRY